MTLPRAMGYGRLVGHLFSLGVKQQPTSRLEEVESNVWTEIRTNAPRSKPTDQLITIKLGNDATLNGGLDFFPVDVNGTRSDTGLTGVITLTADVALALLGLNLTAYTRDAYANGKLGTDGYLERAPIITFVGYVQPQAPQAYDPYVTIGSVGSTKIRVLAGADLQIAAPVNVTLIGNYTRLANFPLPVGTSPGTLLNGTTKAFYKPEAAALVAASVGSYA
jgi:hypothetical protein